MEIQEWKLKKQALQKKIGEEIKNNHIPGAVLGVYEKGCEVFF